MRHVATTVARLQIPVKTDLLHLLLACWCLRSAIPTPLPVHRAQFQAQAPRYAPRYAPGWRRGAQWRLWLRSGVVSLETGLAYATNEGNLRLQLGDLLHPEPPSLLHEAGAESESEASAEAGVTPEPETVKH